MKKALKVAAGFAVAGVCGLAAAGWYVTRPDWQRARVLAALRAEGWAGDIREVRAGLSGVFLLSGAELVAPDGALKLAVSRAEGELDLWDSIWGEPRVRRLTVDGLRVVLPGSRAADRPEGPGLPPVLTPMPRVRVDAASVSGEVLPADGVPVRFGLRVRDADTTMGGKLALEAARAGVTAKVDGAVRFEGAPLVGGTVADFLRSARPLPDLDADLVAAGAPVRLDLRGAGETLVLKSHDGDAVAELRVVGAYGESPACFLKWRLDDKVLAGRIAGAVPRFVSTGRASWSRGGPLEVDAEYSGGALVAGGPGHLLVSGTVEMPGARRFVVRRARIAVGDSSKTPQFTAETAAPIAFTLTPGGAPRPDPASGELLKIALNRLPLVWLKSVFVGAAIRPTAGFLDGNFCLEAPASGGWRLHMPIPVTASGVTLALPRGRSVGGLRLAVSGEVAAARDGAVSVRDAAAVVYAGGEAASVRGIAATLSPDGEFSVAGDFGLNPAVWPELFGTAAASGYFRETELRLKGRAAVTGSPQGGAILRSAEVSAVTAAGATPLVARLEQPLAANAPALGGLAVGVVMHDAPLALINPFLDGEPLDGVARDGRIRVTMTPHGAAVVSDGAVRVDGLIWRPLGLPATAPEPVAVTGGFAWTPSADGWRLRLNAVDAVNRHGPGLRGDLDWTHEDHAPDRILANLRGSLGAVFASAPAWSPGRFASGDFTAIGEVKLDGEARWRIALSGLIPAPGEAPRSLVCSGTSSPAGADYRAQTSVVIKGPSGESRLEASARYVTDGGVVEATVRGDRVYPDDWLAFSRVIGDSRPEAGSAPIKSSPPFAALAPAKLTFAIDEARYADESFTDVRGVVVTTPTTLTFSDVAWRWRTLDVRGGGMVSGPSPWRYALDFGIPAADAEPFLRTVSPAAAARLSGVLALKLKASAEAPEADGLLWATRASVSAAGAGGRLRYAGEPRAPGALKQAAGSVLDLPGDVVGKIGGVFGNEDSAVAKLLHSMNLVRNALGEIRYERLEFTAERATTGVWEPVKLDVSNSLLRLAASGRIGAPTRGVPWTDRRCAVEVRVGGKLGFADALRAWSGSRAEEKDGYVLGPVIRLEGTLGGLDADLMKSLTATVPGGDSLGSRIRNLIP